MTDYKQRVTDALKELQMTEQFTGMELGNGNGRHIAIANYALVLTGLRRAISILETGSLPKNRSQEIQGEGHTT